MKRKVYDQLLEWKEKWAGHYAMLVEGARRIGKSYIVEQFAKNEFDSYIIIDFNNAPKPVFKWFDNYLGDLDTLLNNIQVQYGKMLTPGKSVIVFDEVQICPRARAAIKYLVADGRFAYIETGSLISIKKNVKDIVIPSEEMHIQMTPMDFEEFLWANGNEMLMPYIESCFKERKPLKDLHRMAMNLFREYMLVGGMPQAVLKYVETKDYVSVEKVKREIINLYRNDIQKYASNIEHKVKSIFDQIPAQLQQHEKKFRLSSLKDGASYRDYDDAFFWLADSGIVNICYGSSAPNVGLRLNMQRSTLKCYLSDTGLLISHSFDESGDLPFEIYQKLILGKLEVNEGMLVENVVAQMLVASGHKLYFYSKSSNVADERMEIDFLISKQNITNRHNIMPVEVKSSKNYTLSSLKKCIDKFDEYVTTPCVIHSADLKLEDGILYIPLYMTPLIGKL